MKKESDKISLTNTEIVIKVNVVVYRILTNERI